MGARPLRRAIQRYIEDPLADFVLREELVAGGTVMVEPPAEEDPDAPRDKDAPIEMRLTIVKPEKTPVGVGGREELEAREQPVIDEPGGALDQPAVPPPADE